MTLPFEIRVPLRLRAAFAVCLLLALHPCPGPAVAATNAAAGGAAPVVIDFYFEPGCDECARVKEEVIPQIQTFFESSMYVLNYWDTSVQSNYVRLAAAMDRLGVRDNAPVFMILDGEEVLAGDQQIAERIIEVVNLRLAARAQPSAPVAPPPASAPADDASGLLAQRARNFAFASVIVAGLLDGLNPCAFSTLVFLISVLSMSRVRGRGLLLVGATFCLASFLTYTAIGFGLLNALRAVQGFRGVQVAIDWILFAVLIGLAFYSFRDAYRYGRSGRSEDVSLQLPDKLKQRIHRILRIGLGAKAQLTSTFVIGVMVTGLESVCTGQVYVPTLALVAKSGGAGSLRAVGFLLLYNVMFIVPLVVVFTLTYQGLKLAQLMEWSKKNVIISKILMGVLFLGLATMILILR